MISTTPAIQRVWSIDGPASLARLRPTPGEVEEGMSQRGAWWASSPRDSPRIDATGCALDAAGRLVMAAHGVDGGGGLVAVDLHLDGGAVGLRDVRLVRGAAVHVGLDALDRAGHLRQGGGLDLGGHVAGQRLLGLAVDRVPAAALMLRAGGRRRRRRRRG